MCGGYSSWRGSVAAFRIAAVRVLSVAMAAKAQGVDQLRIATDFCKDHASAARKAAAA